MEYDPIIHHRRSIRLRDYDYTQTGAYFITVCTQTRQCLFGHIINGIIELNDAGKIVADEWIKTAELRHEIELDAWVVMPDHFHGILIINRGQSNRRGTALRAPTGERFGKPISGSIPTIVRSFKSAVTKRINALQNTPGTILWQRGYWERVIRDEFEMDRIREYIRDNPLKWQLDNNIP